MPGHSQHFFAVPASGGNTGRKVLNFSIGNKSGVQFCFLDWCLAELKKCSYAIELTQEQCETAIRTRNWLPAYKRAHSHE